MGELEAFLMSKDLLYHNDVVNKEGQKRNESEKRMSMEVKLMLSLSKTVTFSLKKNNNSSENKKSGGLDTTDNHTSGTLNRKDRFGSLRSSLRRKKHNSGGNNNSQGDAKEVSKMNWVLSPSLFFASSRPHANCETHCKPDQDMNVQNCSCLHLLQ